MIATVWGLAARGRTNQGMPNPLDAALLTEAFGEGAAVVDPADWPGSGSSARAVAPHH